MGKLIILKAWDNEAKQNIQNKFPFDNDDIVILKTSAANEKPWIIWKNVSTPDKPEIKVFEIKKEGQTSVLFTKLNQSNCEELKIGDFTCVNSEINFNACNSQRLYSTAEQSEDCFNAAVRLKTAAREYATLIETQKKLEKGLALLVASQGQHASTTIGIQSNLTKSDAGENIKQAPGNPANELKISWIDCLIVNAIPFFMPIYIIWQFVNLCKKEGSFTGLSAKEQTSRICGAVIGLFFLIIPIIIGCIPILSILMTPFTWLAANVEKSAVESKLKSQSNLNSDLNPEEANKNFLIAKFAGAIKKGFQQLGAFLSDAVTKIANKLKLDNQNKKNIWKAIGWILLSVIGTVFFIVIAPVMAICGPIVEALSGSKTKNTGSEAGKDGKSVINIFVPGLAQNTPINTNENFFKGNWGIKLFFGFNHYISRPIIRGLFFSLEIAYTCIVNIVATFKKAGDMEYFKTNAMQKKEEIAFWIDGTLGAAVTTCTVIIPVISIFIGLIEAAISLSFNINSNASETVSLTNSAAACSPPPPPPPPFVAGSVDSDISSAVYLAGPRIVLEKDDNRQPNESSAPNEVVHQFQID